MFSIENRTPSLSRQDLVAVLGLLCALLISSLAGFGADCDALRGHTVRLHILANSDAAADQALKLQVRDRILQETAGAFAQPQTRQAALATAQATACSRIGSKSASRLASLSFLESFNPSTGRAGSNITAAAKTGPANGPRPASSIPPSSTAPLRRNCSSNSRLVILSPPSANHHKNLEKKLSTSSSGSPTL